MVRWASENGYDKIAWTTGEQQALRYKEALLKQVDIIDYKKLPNGNYELAFSKNGVDLEVPGMTNLPPEVLSEKVGKEIGKQILAGEGKINAFNKEFTELSTKDLTVGGEGMKGFYDKILPDYMNKFGKKWGAKVGEIEIPSAEKRMTKVITSDNLYNIYVNDELMAANQPLVEANRMVKEYRGKEFTAVHSLDITPSMKKSVVEQGLPLFQLAPPVAAGAGLAGAKALQKKEQPFDPGDTRCDIDSEKKAEKKRDAAAHWENRSEDRVIVKGEKTRDLASDHQGRRRGWI